jgi:hypothetical protein
MVIAEGMPLAGSPGRGLANARVRLSDTKICRRARRTDPAHCRSRGNDQEL